MIHDVLNHLTNYLNGSIKSLKGLKKDIVLLNNLLMLDGSISKEAMDKIVLMFLYTNIDRVYKNISNELKTTSNQRELYMLFVSTFIDSKYLNGIEFLDQIIDLIYENNVFQIEGTLNVNVWLKIKLYLFLTYFM